MEALLYVKLWNSIFGQKRPNLKRTAFLLNAYDTKGVAVGKEFAYNFVYLKKCTIC